MERRGTTLAVAFQRFAVWNIATGSRAGGGAYADAASYPEVPVTPVDAGEAHAGSTLSLSARYYQLNEPAQVAIQTDLARNRVWHVPLIDGVAQVEQAMPLTTRHQVGVGVLAVVGVTTARSDAAYTLAFDSPAIDAGVDAAGSQGGSGPDLADAGIEDAAETAEHGRQGSACALVARPAGTPASLAIVLIGIALRARRRSRAARGGHG